ncbi:hypothetical protein [Natrarchaeobius halalkaliphilus]|uniref:hypothetical protein n=1 Tax=Natrarchaeobius halalkaliphilus TaxID=1679091 RepID=UPI000F5309C0|nr:hypothetical protein [Natrarchaeobius halalkaliphilus]
MSLRADQVDLEASSCRTKGARNRAADMNALTATLLQTEPALPMDVVGWGTLVLALVVVLVWLAYLYR